MRDASQIVLPLSAAPAVPLVVLNKAELATQLKTATPRVKALVKGQGFEASALSFALLTNDHGVTS